MCAGWNRTEAEMEIKGWEKLGNSGLPAEMSRHLKSRLSAGSCTKKSTRTESECRLRSELLELLFGACPSWWHRDVNGKSGCRSLKGWREHILSDREETRACSLHASLSTPASHECPGDALGLIRLNASVRRCSRAAIEWRDICETLMCVSSLTRSRMALTFTPGKEPDAIIYLRHPPPSSLLEDGAGICHYSLNLNQGYYFSHLTSFSPLCDSSSIHHSLLCSLYSFFYLPAVESLPNEVADGSILLRDRVERLPTLKSINLTVSISTQTSLSTLFQTKKTPQLCCYPACPSFFELTNNT